MYEKCVFLLPKKTLHVFIKKIRLSMTKKIYVIDGFLELFSFAKFSN